MQLHRHKQDIEAAGARLVLIGNGTPNFIEGFRERTGYTGPIYTDPDRELYRELELKRSVGSAVNLRSMGRAFSALRKGHRQTRTQGDPWQQGGVFVVTGDGSVLFEHRSAYAGDHPEVDDIVSALRGAPAAAAN